MQTRRALKRISTFLDEEEVSEQTSSLKSDYSIPPSTDSDDALGFSHASFEWNSVPEQNPTNGTTNGVSQPKTRADGHNIPTDSRNSIQGPLRAADVQFELRDLNIRFPQGKLTIVTGPTASGKTALLV